jgi:hypothetical protein
MDRQIDLSAAQKGLIPWSTKEFYWAYAEQSKSKLKSVSNFNDVLALAEIFQKRYPDELTFKAHMMRFHSMKLFIAKNALQLMKDGFAATEGEAGFRNELLDVLCTVPFANGGGFSYSQVKTEALKKMNAGLN